MTGNAQPRVAARFDQSAGANIEARLERAFRNRDVAGDQKNARYVRLASGPRQKIVERFARRHFARGDMRDRIETGAAQRGGGVDVVAIVVAGQEGDRHIRAWTEIIPQVDRKSTRLNSSHANISYAVF